MAEYLIGTSGWHYEDWRGRFYPEKLAKSQWLDYYARHFPTVELNNSFYRLPSEKAFQNWYRFTPDGFTFAVKASRFITHIKRLQDVREPVATFLERAGQLQEKLGPVLYQLPPSFRRNDDRLKSFLKDLPGGKKHVLEFRRSSWFEEGVFEALRKYQVAFCIFDMPSLHSPLAATADFAYVRFHGSDSLYSSDYSDQQLQDWAGKLADLGRSLQKIFIYFNNDVAGFAVKNAETLRNYLEK